MSAVKCLLAGVVDAFTAGFTTASTATWAALTFTAGGYMQDIAPAFADGHTPNNPLQLLMHGQFFTKKANWTSGNDTTQQQSWGLFFHMQL